MITVPILRDYKDVTDEVCGMVKDEDNRLIVKINPARTKEELFEIFGKVAFKGVTSTLENGVERYSKIHIFAWSI